MKTKKSIQPRSWMAFMAMLACWLLPSGAWASDIGNDVLATGPCGDNLTYENLYAHLPRETREYLPALVAAMYVNSNRIILFPESVSK